MTILSAFPIFGRWAFLFLLPFAFCLFPACARNQPPAAGQATYERTEYLDTGAVKSHEVLVVAQNEDPSSSTTIVLTAPERGLDVSFGTSFVRKIPKSFAHMESMLVAAGIVCLLGAALFGGIGKHWKLMTISGVTGIALIAIAVTIEAYAWAYGLGLLAAATALGWYLWQRYRRSLSDVPGLQSLVPTPLSGDKGQKTNDK